MSIGRITQPVSTPASGTAPSSAPATTPAPALRDPRLAAHAAALADVLAGAATLGFGASGPHVRAIQEVLAAAGFPAPASGTIDRPAQQQIALFQRQRGLAATGEIDRDTLAALDAAAAGGASPAASARPVIGAAPAAPAAPVDPLEGKLYIDKSTFAGMPSWSWARDSVELESVYGVRGMDPAALRDALRSTDAAGRTLYQRLRRPDMAGAFAVGYPGVGIDDLRWDAESHRARESLEYVSLTVESGRYEPDPRTGAREVSVGTDKMDDTYYDTASFDLLRNGFSVRARARWDTDTEIRRILIGVKANGEIDEFGLKRCEKTDIRNDGASPEEIAALDADLRSGKTHWNGGEEPIKPLEGVYDALAAKGLLPDIGPHEDVLLLEPKVHIRQVRSRFHLGESPLSAVRALHENGAEKVRAALELAARAKAAGGLSAQERAALEALERDGQALLAAGAMPERPRGVSSFEELEGDRRLAEDLDANYHAFAARLDDLRRALCDARDSSLERHARMFAAWQKATDRALAGKGAFDPFLAKYDGMGDQDREAFNAYGEARRAAGDRDFRDFAPLDADGWRKLRPAILNEVVRIHEREIEAAGTAALQLWFDEARSFYVPESYRNTGDFLIDTFDMSEFVRHDDWESIPEASRTPASPLPADKVFYTSLVSETQIELGMEKPYLDRMKELQAIIEQDRASILMKWMTAGGFPGIDPAVPATYGTALAAIAALPESEIEAVAARLNDYARGQGSALRPISAKDLRRLDPALLTIENRDRPVRTDGSAERDLDGARFVFERYRDAQKRFAEARGGRVLRMLRDAGAPRDIAWEPTDAAKGEMALKTLAGIP